jgi:hypothetical protein
MNAFCSALEQIPVMGLMLFITLTAALVILGYMQAKRDQLDLRWLILDDKNARPSIHKIGQVLALIVSTWGFVNLVNKGTLTEYYFTAYMGIWAGSVALNKMLDNKAPAGTTTIETSSTTVSSTDVQATDTVVSVDIKPQGTQ